MHDLLLEDFDRHSSDRYPSFVRKRSFFVLPTPCVPWRRSSVILQGCSRAGSSLAGKVGLGRVGLTRPDPWVFETLLTPPTRPDPTRPDPWYSKKFLTRPASRVMTLDYCWNIRSYLPLPVNYAINPFRTPVPFWGRGTQIPSNLSPIVPKTRLQS